MKELEEKKHAAFLQLKKANSVGGLGSPWGRPSVRIVPSPHSRLSACAQACWGATANAFPPRGPVSHPTGPVGPPTHRAGACWTTHPPADPPTPTHAGVG